MTSPQEYQVLARKYRPQTFSDLIGQEAMVRTLTNAFESGRIAHAFLLTGVRGIGKTTTARIIAKGLNCMGPDGKATKPTTHPCGICPACTSISEDRNMDVLELDAASNTQVDKMREILAGVPYRPTALRYKIYIFDEVHMLSNSAFNAILKTLEEPPAHVKFIFATTEIRKVPVTVLSRCQRFDLRRVHPEEMVRHLENIATSENATTTQEALRLLTRSAGGSVRDAISLLDQAIAMDQGDVTAQAVRAMIGLADQGRILDLFENLMRGELVEALSCLRALYHDGADPGEVLSELATTTHWISLLKISDQIEDDVIAPDTLARGKALAADLDYPVLTRFWQMLLGLLEELPFAPTPLLGAEMAILRLCLMSDQPLPSEILAHLTATSGQKKNNLTPIARAVGHTPSPPQTHAVESVNNTSLAHYARFEDVLTLIRTKKDIRLLMDIERFLRLEHYAPGQISFALDPNAPQDLPQRLRNNLDTWTESNWTISVKDNSEKPTIQEKDREEKIRRHRDAEQDPIMLEFRTYFPKAKLLEVLPPVDQPKNEIESQSNDPDSGWDIIDNED